MAEHHIHTEIEIEAAPGRVWSILTDFAAYPEWNPFIRLVRGIPQRGARLEVRIQPSGGKGMTFRPRVLSADAGLEFRWLGHLGFPGLFDGEHCFAIEPVADGKVCFKQSERFSGVLVPLFKKALERDTKQGFEAMNLALKTRAEGIAQP